MFSNGFLVNKKIIVWIIVFLVFFFINVFVIVGNNVYEI